MADGSFSVNKMKTHFARMKQRRRELAKNSESFRQNFKKSFINEGGSKVSKRVNKSKKYYQEHKPQQQKQYIAPSQQVTPIKTNPCATLNIFSKRGPDGKTTSRFTPTKHTPRDLSKYTAHYRTSSLKNCSKSEIGESIQQSRRRSTRPISKGNIASSTTVANNRPTSGKKSDLQTRYYFFNDALHKKKKSQRYLSNKMAKSGMRAAHHHDKSAPFLRKNPASKSRSHRNSMKSIQTAINNKQIINDLQGLNSDSLNIFNLNQDSQRGLLAVEDRVTEFGDKMIHNQLSFSNIPISNTGSVYDSHLREEEGEGEAPSKTPIINIQVNGDHSGSCININSQDPRNVNITFDRIDSYIAESKQTSENRSRLRPGSRRSSVGILSRVTRPGVPPIDKMRAFLKGKVSNPHRRLQDYKQISQAQHDLNQQFRNIESSIQSRRVSQSQSRPVTPL